MLRAATTGRLAVTAPTRLITAQASDNDLVLYLPFYAGADEVPELGRRAELLRGWIAAGVRVETLFGDLFAPDAGIGLRIEDVTEEVATTIFSAGIFAHDPRFKTSSYVLAGGRAWRLGLVSQPSLEAAVFSHRPELILAGGILLSLALWKIMAQLVQGEATARERARELTAELEEREAQWQRLVANLPGVVQRYRLAPDGSATLPFISAQVRELYGVTPQAAMANPQRLFDMIVPEDLPLVLSSIRRSAETLSPWACNWRISRAGRIVWLQGASVPEREPDGAIVWDGIVIDVTDLQLARAAAMASNAELEQFSYAVSHDLQEPLRTVSMFLGLLQRRHGDALDADARELVDVAIGGAQRMSHMIRDLLEYSRINRKGEPFHPVDLGRSAQEALGALRSSLEAAGAEVQVGALPTVVGDAGQLARLLQNLVGNAVKYSDPARPPRIAIEAEKDGEGAWRIVVADNGIGIDPMFFDKLFQVFERLHGPQAYEGTGIGLAVCRRIVERHGGRIWVESEPGRGSRFIFSLPAAVEVAHA